MGGGHDDGDLRLDDTRRLMFRSDPMKYIQIFIPRDQARDVVANLGKVGAVEFVDLNGDLSAFQRTFVDKIRKCDDVMKQLGVLFDHVERAKIEIPDYEPPVTTPVQRKSTEQLGDLQFSNVTIEELPEILAKVTENIDYLDSNYQNLAKQKGQLVEYKTVLELASKFLSVSEFAGQSVGEEKESPRVPEDEEPILMGSPVAQSSLLDDQHLDERIGGLHVEDGSRLIRRISGTINESKRIIMERMLFRASRGNVISRFIQVKDAIEDPSSGESAKKLVFILFFSGQRVREKINKILTTLNASVYSVPDSSADQQQLISDTTRNIDQQADVLEKTRRLRDRSLQEIVGDLGLWKFKVTKERAIYTEMNKFNPDMSRASLVAEGWVCDHMLSKVRETLSKTSSFGNDSPGPVMTVIHPPPPHAGIIPTHIETNEFTGPFQSIVDSYGKPNYREFNPGLFTIISFPFLFAIMFGDVGHGFLMVLGAAYLIYNEEKMKKQKNMSEMIRIVFGGRWVVLLMGLFSVYVGFIYNEVFSLPLPMWGQTQWTQITSHAGSARQLGVYPFGLDPAWASTSVALSYFNSLKMKMAIVFGVVQMVLGIFVGLSNFIYFRKKLDIYFTFIPQIIFMTAIFGYLVIMIFIKWGTNWQSPERISRDAPSLLQMMILMFLSSNDSSRVQLYKNQDGVESFLKAIAFICIPLLLIPKPAYLWWKNKNAHVVLPVHDHEHDDHADHKHEEFNFGEIVTMQLIHTLEFVLGCISNTASYLRLWALSLAHSQLSLVFWNYFIKGTMKSSGFMTFVGFAIWISTTMGVLMLMESLSAFLHALRLHWVEFQNKFYGGSGKPFLPFSISKLTS